MFMFKERERERENDAKINFDVSLYNRKKARKITNNYRQHKIK